MRAALLLLLLCAVAMLPQVLAPEWRGTEARRIQVAREMVMNQDWFVPTLGGEATLAKPPLYYWLLAAVQELGTHRALLRAPSVLAFWLLAVACYRALRRRFDPQVAAISACGILLSPAVLDLVPYAEIDALFAALAATSMLWLAQGAAFSLRGRLVMAGLAGGLAILTKGPPYFLFLAGAGLVWLRHFRCRGLLWFLPALALLPIAYYAPLLLARIPPSELASVAGEESIGRIGTFTLAHVLDTPLYLLRAVALFLPLGLWTLHEYRGGQGEMRPAVLGRHEGFLRMCAGAAIGAVLLLVLFPGRPSRYLLPAVPCYLVALGPAVAAYTRRRDAPSPLFGALLRWLGILGSALVVCAAWLPAPFDRSSWLLAFAFAVAPFLVTSRPLVVAWVLGIPLFAAWTVLADYGSRRSHPPRTETAISRSVERELEALGANADLATHGHVPAEILLGQGRIVPGDERQRRIPTSRWLLVEDPDKVDPGYERVAEQLSGYRDRVRWRLSRKTLVLKERRPPAPR